MTAVMPSPARSDALRASLTAATAALFGVGWGANQFAPLLLVYHSDLGVGEATIEAMFGVYAVGLIPGLLIGGPLSDRIGRRAVVLPAAALSVLATVLLMFGGQTIVALFAGRLLAGIVSGAVFSAATTWLRETSLAAGVGASAASRTAAAMSAGFGLGPLVAGMIAQWAPAPTVLPYVPHVLLMVVVLALLRRAPADEIRPAVPAPLPGRRARLAIRSHPRFRWIVVPLAPWAFAAPVIAVRAAADRHGGGDRDHGIVFAAALAAITALTGAVVQPVARRLGLSPIALGCAGSRDARGRPRPRRRDGRGTRLGPRADQPGARLRVRPVPRRRPHRGAAPRLAAGARPCHVRLLRADLSGLRRALPPHARPRVGVVSDAADARRGPGARDRRDHRRARTPGTHRRRDGARLVP